MSSTFSHLQKNVVNVVVGRKKNGLWQNRTILHDTCELSVISINRHYTTVNLGKVKMLNKKKKINPNNDDDLLVKKSQLHDCE